MIIERMNDSDVNNIVKIHVETFPNSFLTHLGGQFLYTIYKEFGKNGFAYVAREENDLIGFLAGAYTSAEMFYKTLIKNNITIFTFYFLSVIFRKPGIIIPILQRVNRLYRNNTHVNKTASSEYDSLIQSESKIASALTIAVPVKFRGRGIAREMWNYALHDLPAYGIEAIIGSVQSDNAATNSLYKKMGFKIIARIKRGYIPEEYKWLFYRRDQCSISETGYVTWGYADGSLILKDGESEYYA